MFKVKPWWLRLFTASHTWVTIHPNIYVPPGTDPFSFPEIIAHEKVHLRQQDETGLWKWLWRYITRPAFRLQEESEGAAVEILNVTAPFRRGKLEFYSIALSEEDGVYDPPFGDPAAATTHEARVAILSWMEKISPGSTHDLH